MGGPERSAVGEGGVWRCRGGEGREGGRGRGEGGGPLRTGGLGFGGLEGLHGI